MADRKKRPKDDAGLILNGVKYFTLDDVVALVGVSRQTIWRWRQDAGFPAGHRDRRRRVLFTAEEVDLIRGYAQRIEPIAPGDLQQLTLFQDGGRRIREAGND